MSECRRRFRRGWRCTRTAHPDGPCALVPRWWNLPGFWWGRTRGGPSV